MQTQTLLNRDQAMKALGVTHLRSLQLLVKQGRLDKKIPPGEPTGGPKKRNECYTAESINRELERRRTGVRVAAGNLPAAQAATGTLSHQTSMELAGAQIDGWKALAQHLAKLSEIYQKPAEFAPGAFLNLREAAAWKRRSEAWVKEQCTNGRLRHERTKRGGFLVLMRDLEALPADSAISVRVKRNVA